MLDLLLPPRCLACAAPGRDGLCEECERDATRHALAGGGATVLAPGVRAVAAYAYRGVVRDAVRALKAGGCHAGAAPLGRLLAHRLRLPPADEVTRTWVPSHPRRLRQRGVELTRLLAGSGAVPLLRRTVLRPDQTTLAPAQRRTSPVGAFAALGAVPRAVVLIDDVRTTGATARAAAEALHAGGATRVLVATLAAGGYAPGPSGAARSSSG